MSRCLASQGRARHRRLGAELLRRLAGFALLLFVASVILALVAPAPVAADPKDQLIQTMTVQLSPGGAEVTIAMSGGILANERVLYDLDPSNGSTITPAELQSWATFFLSNFQLTYDNQPATITPANLQITMPPLKAFHLGLKPLVVAFRLQVPPAAAGSTHSLVITNNYVRERTTYELVVHTADGVKVTARPVPSRVVRIAFAIDPAATGKRGSASSADNTTVWGGSGVIGRAQRVLERPKTPALLLTLAGVFLIMGALHALSPGHGKTLVAAYLIATGGTWRDAVALAGIVTFTHTISVFILAAATLAASALFLPSRVVPVLSWISGLLVVGMGLTMLRAAVRRLRRSQPAAGHEHSHAPAGLAFASAIPAGQPAHPHPHTLAHQHRHDHSHVAEEEHARRHQGEASAFGHVQHHHHDHAGLSDEEHTRLHVAEIARARGGDDRKVTFRSLVTLGVSGGMTPCPDALAILLLAVGINQVALGLMAIFAFSVGLAVVLVAFGLAIALAGPFWRRLRGGRGSRLGSELGHLAVYSPLISATLVLLLGLVMLWRSSRLF